MRFSWARMALVSVLATVVVAPINGAVAQQGSDVRVDLNLKDADMMAATQILFQRTGIQFVVEPSSKAYNKITLKLEGVTPEEAVRYICQAAGAYFKRDDNGVYVISQEKPVVQAPLVVKNNQPRPLKKIRILKANARDVYEAILYRLPIDSTAGFDNLRNFVSRSLTASNAMSAPSGPRSAIAAASQAGPSFGPVSSQTSPLTTSESGNNVLLPGESANQFGVGGGRGGGGFGGGQQGGNLGGGQQGGGIGGGQQGGGGGNVNLQGGQGLVGDSIDYITYDPTDNSLVVRGNEDDINQLQTYINMFDVAPRQVQIKVEFITTNQGTSRALGYDFTYSRAGSFEAATGALANPADPVTVSYATGNIAARLRASLVTESGAKVVQSPIIRTLNNQPATIFSQSLTYVFLPQTTVSNGTVIVNYQVQQIPAVSFLAVAPRINDDNTITMYLTPSVTNQVGVSVSPDGQQLPNQSTQSISVVARVKNNETIVLGGFNSLSETSLAKKVPVLGDLPIIGQFFRSSARSSTGSELLIFVTPTVLDEDGVPGPGGP